MWRGYQASKRRYIYGLKLHLRGTETGQPVEFFLAPRSVSDTSAYRDYRFDLPEGPWMTGDQAYTDYDVEDALTLGGLEVQTMRKANSKRPWPP